MSINYGANSRTDVDVLAAFRRAAKEELAAAGRGQRLGIADSVFDR